MMSWKSAVFVLISAFFSLYASPVAPTPLDSLSSSAESGASKQKSAPLKLSTQRFEVDLKVSRLTLRFQGYFDSVAVKGIDVILIPLSGEDTLAATSDRNGFVHFDSLAQGRWSVEATGAHHEMDYAVIHPDTKEGMAVSVFLKKKVSLLWLVLTVLGGLGVFLLGMDAMSQGLQTVAGSSLRRLVAALTSHRLFAVLVGVGVTSIIQSSSITTVMVVGFVNSGIMYFREALGVIMGANIGTTVTAWILVLAVDKWGLPILGAAAFVYLFSKREKVRYTALAVMGIGMVFFGLELMKNGLASVNDSPDFLNAFTLFRADSYFGVMKVALLGCILTMIIQSSSATMGIVIALASQGVISFDTSIALVVGANVGTTITAQLASIGANVDARRCAWFHTSFNLVGTILVIAFFPLFSRLVFFLLEHMMGVSSIVVDGKQTISASSSPTGIALVGTLFNCIMTLLFFPFLNQIASAIEWLLPHKRERVGGDQLYSLSLIEGKHGAVPMTALTIARHKMSQMSNRTVKMAASLESYFNGDDKEKSREDVFQGEAELDQSLREMSKMATDLLGEPLSLQDINEVKTLLKMSEEYESVSDYLAQILKLYLRLEVAGLSLEPAQNKEMIELFQHIYELLLSAAEIELQEDARKYLPKMETKGKAITAYVRKSRDAHWKRLAEGSMHPLASTVYSDLLNAYRKIKNHLFSAVQAQAGE